MIRDQKDLAGANRQLERYRKQFDVDPPGWAIFPCAFFDSEMGFHCGKCEQCGFCEPQPPIE